MLSKRPGAARVAWLCLAVFAVVAAVIVVGARVDPAALSSDLPSGAKAFSAAPLGVLIARLASYIAYAFLLGGALWSAWSMRGRPELRNRFWGTLLIALGATVVAGGSAFAVAGQLAGFSLTLAAGITVMFLGFIRASSRTRYLTVSSTCRKSGLRW